MFFKLSKGNVQKSIISAIGEDPELKKMLVNFGTMELVQILLLIKIILNILDTKYRK